ncbi:MAG: hypothetical protein ACREIT_07705, partial [Tepidisphaeraceae bacterium]
MANGYMPRKDAAARAWLINFAQQLGERPGAYKATQQEADVVRDAVEAFVKALRLAVSPDTRTSLAVLRKDERRQAAELACRPIYLRVKFDPTISNEDKFSLGVRLVNPSRTRIGAPDSAPVLRLAGLSFSGHSIGFADAISPTRRGKPFGATQLQ